MTAFRFGIAAHALLAVYLVGLLTLPRAPSTLAALVCLTALAASAGRWTQAVRDALPALAVFVVPAIAYCLLVLLQIAAGLASPRLGSHLLIVLLALAVGLSGVPGHWPDVRRWLLPAAAVGAVGACAIAVYQARVLDMPRPQGWLGGNPLGTGAIKFGDLAAVLGLLSFVLVLSAQDRVRRMTGLLGLGCGMATLALTQARGGVLGVLLALAALGGALALRRPGPRPSPAPAPAIGRQVRLPASSGGVPVGPAGSVGPSVDPAARLAGRRRTALAMVGVALLVSVASAAFMQKRFAEIEPQVQRFLQGDAASETGQRLALWQAAVRAGLHAPVTGTGFDRFGAELDRQVATGAIPSTMKILYRQPHNEYLAAFAAAGFAGLAVTLLLFFGPPVALICRIARGRDSPAARAALVTSTAFAGFALTDAMFDRQITIIAFHLLTAWLLAAAAGVPPDAQRASAPESAA